MTGQVIDRVDLSEGREALCFTTGCRVGRNLMRVDPMGGILWKARPPTTGTPDCFTRMQWHGQTLTADTWSRRRVGIDLKKGSVTVLAFTR
jgi:hypothetical protein